MVMVSNEKTNNQTDNDILYVEVTQPCYLWVMLLFDLRRYGNVWNDATTRYARYVIP